MLRDKYVNRLYNSLFKHKEEKEQAVNEETEYIRTYISFNIV